MSIELLTSIQPLQPINGNGTLNADENIRPKVPFADILSEAIQDVGQTQRDAAQDSIDLVMGDGADLHTVMIRSAMETAAVETAVELTTRVVSVYKEIMQMQI